MKMPPPQIPTQAQLQALNKPHIQLAQSQSRNQNQRQGPVKILDLPIHKEFLQPPMVPSQIPSQSHPQTPPEMLMSKTLSRIEDDPFKGIGFSNGGMSSQSNAFPQFDLDNNINLFQPNNQSTSQNDYTNNQNAVQTSSNNFDDPFAELVFDDKPKEENKIQAIEAPQPVDISMLKMEKVTPQYNEQFNFEGQPEYKNGPQSTQYDFSDDEGAKDDNFAFDDININLDDLNLYDSPMPKINHPTQTKGKHSVNSGLPIESS